jgi:hypothetical protein
VTSPRERREEASRDFLNLLVRLREAHIQLANAHHRVAFTLVPSGLVTDTTEELFKLGRAYESVATEWSEFFGVGITPPDSTPNDTYVDRARRLRD